MSTAFSDDMSVIGEESDVSPDDILCYGDHSTLVMSVYGEEPRTLIWCWHLSGVYYYAWLYAPSDLWATPMCAGDTDLGVSIDDQEWEWDDDYTSSPTVYTEAPL